MYKRKDSDIFGTSQVVCHPRIQNPSFIDPNAAFKRRTDSNYETYTSQLSSVNQSITKQQVSKAQVNEKAEFGDTYHKQRKQMDLQSSIFYPPTLRPQSIGNDENDFSLANKSNITESNFGRKETMKRELMDLSENNSQFKGNESRLFDINERMTRQSGTVDMIPLIPHGMQWDQHDSVKYSNINYYKKEETPLISESKVYQEDNSEKIQIFSVAESQTQVEEKSTTLSIMTKDVKPEKNENSVEVKILKGWTPKFMQGLAKHCKLNKSAIMSFNSEGEKATIWLKRSERWQNVTDWLRKDCKLKIRVNH